MCPSSFNLGTVMKHILSPGKVLLDQLAAAVNAMRDRLQRESVILGKAPELAKNIGALPRQELKTAVMRRLCNVSLQLNLGTIMVQTLPPWHSAPRPARRRCKCSAGPASARKRRPWESS
jgi:hypothetical protein